MPGQEDLALESHRDGLAGAVQAGEVRSTVDLVRLETRAKGPAGAAVIDAEVLGDEETAPEQLDWGSIDDDDGAFGQIGAAAGPTEEVDLVLPGLQVQLCGEAFTPPGSACVDAGCGHAAPIAQLGKTNGGDLNQSGGSGGRSPCTQVLMAMDLEAWFTRRGRPRSTWARGHPDME